MRQKITRNPDGYGYLAPDGTPHPSIAAAIRHTAGQRPRPVSVAVSTPAVPTLPAAPADFDALTILRAMRVDLRHAQAELAAFAPLPAAPWSAAHRWNVRERARYAARVARLRRRIAAHRTQHGIHEPKFWKPRPAHPADARGRRLFPAAGTPTGWAVPDLHWPEGRVIPAAA